MNRLFHIEWQVDQYRNYVDKGENFCFKPTLLVKVFIRICITGDLGLSEPV